VNFLVISSWFALQRVFKLSTVKAALICCLVSIPGYVATVVLYGLSRN